MIYLTPASISYLTQFALSLAILLFLAIRIRKQSDHSAPLIHFFGFVTLFFGLMFLDASFPPYPRLLVVYLQNTILAIALVGLFKFAYHFPRPFSQHRREYHIGLIVSLIYVAMEGGFAVYRYIALLGHDTVYYRMTELTYANAMVLLWIPIAFARQTVAADARQVPWWRKLWAPQGREAHGTRDFIFVFGIVFLLVPR